MFPSFNCNIDHNSFDESLLKKSPISFPSDLQNPISKLDDPPFLFNFPSPFLDEHESPLNQIFFQNYRMASSDQIYSNSSTDPTTKQATKRSFGGSKMVEKDGDRDQVSPNGVVTPLRRSSRNLGVVPRRRTGKKDRHSKICTAQGIRDRRMRLSLQVARKFFDLQDLLGYDKASKTIEWLFTKSKKAIKELINDHPQGGNNISISDAKSESFLSECEVVSGVLIEDQTMASNKDVTMPILCIDPCENDEKKTQELAIKSSREKARERARCRTREKMVKRFEGSSRWYKPNPNDVQKLGSSNSPFEGVDQESNSSNLEKNSPYEADPYSSFQQHLADVGTIEKFLGNSSSSSSPSWPISENCSATISSYIDPSSSFMGFFGNWDLLNNDKTSSIYSVANQVPLAGNPNSVYSATGEFP